MVSYQGWVSICFEALQDRGAEIDGIDDGATIMQFAAETWNHHQSRLERMGAAKARALVLRYARNY